MNRRQILQASAATTGIAIAGCIGDNGDGDGALEITFGSGYPDTDDYPTGVNTFEETVEEESDGDISVSTHLDGTQGDGQELMQSVQTGGINIGLESQANLSPLVDELNIKHLPYLFETRDDAVEFYEGEGWENNMHPHFRENQYEPLGSWLFDFRWLSVTPGATDDGWIHPEDGEGVDIRVAGADITAQAFDEMGANPVSIDWGETPSALQEGTAEGVHSSSLSHCDLFRDIVEYVQNPNMANTAFSVVANLDWWEGLDETEQDIINEGMDAMMEENTGERQANAIDAAVDCINDGETAEVIELSDSERQEWVDLVGYQNEFWDEAIENHGMTREEVEEMTP